MLIPLPRLLFISVINALKRKLKEQRCKLFRHHQRVRDTYHWEIINHITDENSGVLLPPFETKRVSGMLKAKTNCSMLGISHFTFRMHMKGKCEEKGLLYAEPTEEYTSKTCGACGQVNYLLGSKKTFDYAAMYATATSTPPATSC